jgi:hypothetical protein
VRDEPYGITLTGVAFRALTESDNAVLELPPVAAAVADADCYPVGRGHRYDLTLPVEYAALVAAVFDRIGKPYEAGQIWQGIALTTPAIQARRAARMARLVE